MDAEVIRTELKATEDARVRAGVRAALEHLGERHGLSKAEQREFADEVDAECKKLFAGRIAASCGCDVVISETEDRLKVTVRPATKTSHSKSQDSANGHGCATFVKHFHKKPAHS